MSVDPRTEPARAAEPTAGFLFALAAFLLWGLLPFYLKAVDHIPAWEVVAHRIIWSVPVAGLLLILMRRTADLRAALRSPRTLAQAAFTASLIAVNWGVYVWSIASERAVEAALGYYINPLVNVLLGTLFLGERITRLQAAAIGLAALAVAILTVRTGGLPWVSLTLALTFSLYGFFRKTLPVGAAQGFMLEVVLMSAPAFAFITWLAWSGTGHFGPTGAADIGLLIFAGPATAIPMILYASGARRLRYTTVGLMQYMTPTFIFLAAVFVFGEPFSAWQLIAFTLIWTALVLYSISLWRGPRPLGTAPV